MGGSASSTATPKSPAASGDRLVGRQGRTASLKQSFASSIHGNVWEMYQQKKRLGTGMCGSVYMCENVKTGGQFAVKTIRRDVLGRQKKHKAHSIDTEIEILKTLDHPNVIKLYEVWDDERAIYLVMELCTGGELYEYVNSAQYTERQACNIFHSMVKAIHYCHSRGIAHRDLKLENFLFEKRDPTAHIKLIDFGLSAKYAGTTAVAGTLAPESSIARMTSLVGTSYYVAPEMINRKAYTKACDVWAMGVMLYMILSGEPPFNGSSEKEILKSAAAGKFQFDSYWQAITVEAKDLISVMLSKDPAKRPTTAQVLQHAWFKRFVARKDSGTVVNEAMVNRLQAFGNFSKFKRMAMEMMSLTMNPEQVNAMREAFERIDTENTGVLSLEEFKTAMEKFKGISNEQVEKIFATIDQDEVGVISYSEFLAATLTQVDYLRKDRLQTLFERLDVDGTGSISLSNLKSILGTAYSEQELQDIIKEVDKLGDNQISKHEFELAMRQAVKNMAESDLATVSEDGAMPKTHTDDEPSSAEQEAKSAESKTEEASTNEAKPAEGKTGASGGETKDAESKTEASAAEAKTDESAAPSE